MTTKGNNSRSATPAIAALQAAGADFVVRHFDHSGGDRGYGLAAAAALNIDPDQVFKTLVANLFLSGANSDGTKRDRVEQVVGIVPVSSQLSLRGLAIALGGKRAEMCPVEVAERITGYVAGGISPFGRKKELRTVIDETCVLFETIFVSGGRRGVDLELAPAALIDLLSATVANITAD